MAGVRIKKVDVLEGNLYSAIIRYCIPLLIMGLVQKLFNAVDVMVLGIVADDAAVASVGATSNIVSLTLDSFTGLALGARVVLARLLGAKDEKRAQAAASTSLILSVILGLLSALLGILGAPYFLEWTNCPVECRADALLYIQIYLSGASAVLLYNFASTIIQVSGDANRPMIYMIISGAANVVLNFALCMVLERKVAAVAIATLVSQAIGAALAIARLIREKGALQLRWKTLRWSWESFALIMKNGLPSALAHAMYPIANLQIQTQVNSFGPAYMAGVTATSNLDNILSAIATTPLVTAIATFAGQNLGADNRERVKKTLLFCTALCLSLNLILGVLGNVFSRQLASMFVSDEASIQAARIRLLCVMLPHILAGLQGCLNRAIQTFGYSAFVTVNSMVTVIGFRFFWTWVVFNQYPTFLVLCLCYPVSWILTSIVNAIFFTYIYKKKFKTGQLARL